MTSACSSQSQPDKPHSWLSATQPHHSNHRLSAVPSLTPKLYGINGARSNILPVLSDLLDCYPPHTSPLRAGDGTTMSKFNALVCLNPRGITGSAIANPCQAEHHRYGGVPASHVVLPSPRCLPPSGCLRGCIGGHEQSHVLSIPFHQRECTPHAEFSFGLISLVNQL
jgi:hypothetical protein